MDLLAEGSEVEAEAFGNILLAAVLDEDGTEGFVEALGLAGGLQEEKTARGVIHGGIPGCEPFWSRNSSEEHSAVAPRRPRLEGRERARKASDSGENRPRVGSPPGTTADAGFGSRERELLCGNTKRLTK
jgi:hypothetical protein